MNQKISFHGKNRKKSARKLITLLLAVSLSATALAGESGSHDIILIGADTEREADRFIHTNGLEESDDAVASLTEDAVMLPDTVYEIDLNGDGEAEQISYKTYENDNGQGSCQAVLEIYEDDTLIWNYTDPSWSYSWSLSRFSLGESAYLLAVSKSDNDWTSQALILSRLEENDSLSVLADLPELTRESEENSGALLSGWARVGYGALLSTKENVVTVAWTDTLKSTGNMAVYVDYEISGDTVTQKAPPLKLEEARTWTAWMDFDVYDQPESDTTAYHVSPEDVVSLKELTIVNGKKYLKCVNQDGKEGWFPDSEEYLYQPSDENPELYYQGYFKECIFAG